MDLYDVRDQNILCKQNLYELLSTPAFISLLQLIYDYNFTSFSNDQTYDDTKITFVSTLGSKVINNVIVAKVFDQYANRQAYTLMSYISQPIINSYTYSFLFNTFFKTKYNGKDYGRSDTMVMVLGLLTGFIAQLSDKAIVSFVTGNNYFY